MTNSKRTLPDSTNDYQHRHRVVVRIAPGAAAGGTSSSSATPISSQRTSVGPAMSLASSSNASSLKKPYQKQEHDGYTKPRYASGREPLNKTEILSVVTTAMNLLMDTEELFNGMEKEKDQEQQEQQEQQ